MSRCTCRQIAGTIDFMDGCGNKSQLTVWWKPETTEIVAHLKGKSCDLSLSNLQARGFVPRMAKGKRAAFEAVLGWASTGVIPVSKFERVSA